MGHTMRPINDSITKRTYPPESRAMLTKLLWSNQAAHTGYPRGEPSLSSVTSGVSVAFKAVRELLGEPPECADEWQLEQLIRHGRGTYWKFLLLLWLRDGGFPKEIKAWSWDEFVSPAFSRGPGAGLSAARGFLSLWGLAYCSPPTLFPCRGRWRWLRLFNFNKASSVDLCGLQMPSHHLLGPGPSRLEPLTGLR